MTSKRPRKKGFLLFLLTILICSSCGGDLIDSSDYQIDKLKANPTIALPLAHGSIGIGDFLGEEDQPFVKVADDGLIYLLYEETLVTQSFQELLDFPDKLIEKSYPVVPGILSPTNTERERFTVTSTEDFGFDPERINELKFKSPTALLLAFNFLATNPLNNNSPAFNNFDLRVELPGFTLNGEPFSKRISVQSGQATFSLADYVADLNNNTFALRVTLIERAHNEAITVPEAKLDVDFTFSTMTYRYVKGFFGDQIAATVPSDEIPVNAFGTSLNAADITFAEPKISFAVRNEYGIPTTVRFQPIEARKNNGASLPIIFNVPNPIVTNAPSVMGETAITNVEVTNAAALIDFVPDAFYYEVTGRMNAGRTSGENFMVDTSSLDVSLRVEVPLFGSASNIVLTDTFNVDLNNLENSVIESAGIISNIENELPLGARVQLYLANDASVIFDSLFAANQTSLVKASTVDSNGALQAAGISNVEISLSKEKMEKLLSAKKVILRAVMNTSRNASGQPLNVQFKSNYRMNINFGINVKLKLEVALD